MCVTMDRRSNTTKRRDQYRETVHLDVGCINCVAFKPMYIDVLLTPLQVSFPLNQDSLGFLSQFHVKNNVGTVSI